MLDGCQHRGPDSTGFALYHEADGDGTLRLRFFVGEGDGGRAGRSRDIKAQARRVRGRGRRGGARSARPPASRSPSTATCRPSPTRWSTSRKVASIGESLDIIKDVGGAHDVDDAYHVAGFTGTHGIGHVRLATESDVSPEAGHPFWATGFADVAIVHNGQITNYWKMRRRLEKRGFEFNTDNDSELIAVYLADKLEQGSPLEDALRTSIEDLDGTFSFLVSTKDEIGYAKDRLAAKPMVMYEDDDLVAIASEEVSLNKLFPGKSLETIRAAPGTFERGDDRSSRRLGHRGERLLLAATGRPARTSTSSTRTPATTSASGSRIRSRVRVHGSAGYFCAGPDRRAARRGRRQRRLGPRRQHARAAPSSCAATPARSPASPSAAPTSSCTATSARAPAR